MQMTSYQNCVGMDEVGRGPLAGPVTVTGVLWLSEQSPKIVLEGIRDSKKLSQKAREKWMKSMQEELSEFCVYKTASVDAVVIDRKGIKEALLQASAEVLNALQKYVVIQHVLADYSLPVPKRYVTTHIIKGDENEEVIALASIIAKVERDALMKSYAEQFSAYGLEKNKGYGTKEHIEALQKNGPSELHRKTFLTNILADYSS